MSVKAPVRTKRIDWSRMVFDLEKAGMSQRQISEACDMGTETSWANRLKNIPGTQPKFHNGALFLGLWMRVTGKKSQDVPFETA